MAPLSQKNVLSPADDDGSASFDDEAENLDVTERLLRKVSKRPGLSDSGRLKIDLLYTLSTILYKNKSLLISWFLRS